jgi:hypothetical protein
MLREDYSWVWMSPVVAKKNFKDAKDYLAHCGKWIIYAPMDDVIEMGNKMIRLVGNGDILNAKVSKNPALSVPEGYAKGRDHVIIAYCDDRDNWRVKSALEKALGPKMMFWKYDRETIKENLGTQDIETFVDDSQF